MKTCLLGLGVEFGELLYQLRAALDSCVYDAAIFETGQDPPPDAEKLEFPICTTSKGFQQSRRKIAPLPEPYRAFIEEMQPYNAPPLAQNLESYNVNRNLAILNDWSRKDRHRSLHLARSWASNRQPVLELPEGVALDWMHVTPDGHLEAEDVVATFHLSGWRPGMDIYGNPNLDIEVSVDEPPLPRDFSETLGPRSKKLCQAVELIAFKFRDTALRFRRPDPSAGTRKPDETG